MYNLTVQDRLATREYARATGDVNLERACNADLVLNGYREDVAAVAAVASVVAEPVMETTEAAVQLERAVPDAPKRGRKPMPRCEHNNIAGRCAVCEEEE